MAGPIFLIQVEMASSIPPDGCVILTEEARARMSRAGKGRPKSPEWRARMSALRKAAIQDGRLSMKGEKNPRFGRPLSEDTRSKIRAKALGRPLPQSARAKLSAFHAGKPKSEEHKAKISGSLLKSEALREANRRAGAARRRARMDGAAGPGAS